MNDHAPLGAKSLASAGLFFWHYLVPMSYLDDHLLTGERIVYRARLHWTIFLTSIVVVLLGIEVFKRRQAKEMGR